MRALTLAFALPVALLLGGCVKVFCHSAPVLYTQAEFPITADECVKGFKEYEEWRAQPVAAPGQCPGTSVWNGSGCTTSTTKSPVR